MRVAYTAGVLDAFLDKGIDIPYVIGVSAGANAGSDYVAGQRERNHRVFVDLVADRRYAGVRNLVRERSWFGMRFLFETLPDHLAPFDYARFRESPRKLVIGVTDCTTAQATYFSQWDCDPRWFVHTLLRATSSLPVISPPVQIDGRRYLDGGLSDPIPIQHSRADGNTRNIVVLTRNPGYRKKPERLSPIVRLALARYPAVREAIADRHLRYNACLDTLAALEKQGEVFVLQPLRPLSVDRMTRDLAELDALYRQGYGETLERLPALKAWLGSQVDIGTPGPPHSPAPIPRPPLPGGDSPLSGGDS
jgi:predicted patatin/cPLA2 family phospholipase